MFLSPLEEKEKKKKYESETLSGEREKKGKKRGEKREESVSKNRYLSCYRAR